MHHDAKDEILHLLNADLEPGDLLKRIHVPQGWPEETVTVRRVYVEENHFNGESHVMVELAGPISKTYRTLGVNIPVLYERIPKEQATHLHEQT